MLGFLSNIPDLFWVGCLGLMFSFLLALKPSTSLLLLKQSAIFHFVRSEIWPNITKANIFSTRHGRLQEWFRLSRTKSFDVLSSWPKLRRFIHSERC